MISVIILTKNLKYAVLDVPASGVLQIKELHLICGMVQNGVKVLPYGDVLSSFETYIQNETLSVGIIPHSEFQQEGRILDFTVIELLQLSTTIPVSSSGSATPFVAPTYSSGGYPVNYNLRIKGTNFATPESAEYWLQGGFGGTSPTAHHQNLSVNAVANDGDYQLLSVINNGFSGFLERGLFNRPEVTITEFYDLGGIFKEAQIFTMDSTAMEIFSFSGLTKLHSSFISNLAYSTTLNLLELPSLLFIGGNTGDTDTLLRMPNYSEMKVPRALETANAGAVEGDLLSFINDQFGIVTYID